MQKNDASEALTALIADDRRAVPTLVFYVGLDLGAARELALEDLRANPHHQAIEVCAEDQLLFVVRREDLEVQSTRPGGAGRRSGRPAAFRQARLTHPPG